MIPGYRKLLLPATFLLLGIYYTFPFLLKLEYWGIRDWDLFTTIAAVPIISILDYGQFPFWNPYMGGGNILFHHPEVAVLSPFLLLYLLFGAVVGLKLQVLICYFLGFWGSFRLFSTLGLSRLASLMGIVAYFGSVHFALHFAEGHMPFTHYCFLPWFIDFILRAEQSKKNLLWAGISLALMILGNGAAIPLLYTGLFSLLLFSGLAIEHQKLIHLKNFVISFLMGVGLSAIKFIPMVIYLFQNQWIGNPDESIPASALWPAFFGLNHSLKIKIFADQTWAWHEYGVYISPLLVVMAIVGLLMHFRKGRIWILLAGFFLLLGLGNFGNLSPWALLTKLPGFASARCTGRAFQFVILSMAVLGGFGFDSIRDRLKAYGNKILALLYVALGVVVLTNLILVWPIMNEAFRRMPELTHESYDFYHVADRNAKTYKNLLENKGSLITPWLSAYHPSRALIDYQNNVLMEHVRSGKLEIESKQYTPNSIEYTVNATIPGEITLGMGFDPGWTSTDGRYVRDLDGLITVPFEVGRQEIVLKYQTPYWYLGGFLSLLSVVVIILSFRYRKNSI